MISTNTEPVPKEPSEAEVARALFNCLLKSPGLIQSNGMRLLGTLTVLGVLMGGIAGALVGKSLYGMAGLAAGAVAGLILGYVLGGYPGRLFHRRPFLEVRESSPDKLWQTVANDPWEFFNTLAILELAARGENVRMELPRVVKMLESESVQQRMHAWNAVWMVFPDVAAKIPDYEPASSLEECQTKARVVS